MLYNCLPVYKASYDLLLEIFVFTRNLSREFKYTLGQDLKTEATNLIVGIYRANKSYEKQEILEKTRERLEVIRLYIRILKDLKEVNMKRFAHINQKIELVSKQLAGWQNSKK